jgi:hypothetical protein
MGTLRCERCSLMTSESVLVSKHGVVKTGQKITFDSLATLDQSAGHGCDLCALFRQHLFYESIARHENFNKGPINGPIVLTAAPNGSGLQGQYGVDLARDFSMDICRGKCEQCRPGYVFKQPRRKKSLGFIIIMSIINRLLRLCSGREDTRS